MCELWRLRQIWLLPASCACELPPDARLVLVSSSCCSACGLRLHVSQNAAALPNEVVCVCVCACTCGRDANISGFLSANGQSMYTQHGMIHETFIHNCVCSCCPSPRVPVFIYRLYITQTPPPPPYSCPIFSLAEVRLLCRKRLVLSFIPHRC